MPSTDLPEAKRSLAARVRSLREDSRISGSPCIKWKQARDPEGTYRFEVCNPHDAPSTICESSSEQIAMVRSSIEPQLAPTEILMLSHSLTYAELAMNAPSDPEISRPTANPTPSSAQTLFPLVYRELHLLADRWMQHERGGHTLQATALVHEAYLRVARWAGDWNDCDHFKAVAVRAIRQVLINHAMARQTLRRGGGRDRVLLSEDLATSDTAGADILSLDEALVRLESLHERQARVVELRFFGGLTVEETAEVLDCSARTVDGDWSVARAWLRDQLSREAG
jgi:RNA polymerase sigma-70 factor, ECF subfamily